MNHGAIVVFVPETVVFPVESSNVSVPPASMRAWKVAAPDVAAVGICAEKSREDELPVLAVGVPIAVRVVPVKTCVMR